MHYEPNRPLARLRWVEKTFGHRPRVVYDTLRAALSTLGFDSALIRPWAGHATGQGMPPLTQMGAGGDGLKDPAAWITSESINELESLLDAPNRADFLFPWMAAQLAQRHKRIERARKRRRPGDAEEIANIEAMEDEYLFLDRAFVERGAAIAQWAERSGADVGSMGAHEVLEHVATYVPEIDVPQQHVVYQFEDGWTVQELMSPESLLAEGEAMQHCVGSYCGAVARSEAIIYSLRDPKGRPHVTMEFDPREGQFLQIYGKQNQRPKPEYAARARDFIRTFDSPNFGLLLAGGEPGLDFEGYELGDARDDESLFVGVDLRGANFAGMDLSYFDFNHSNLAGANFRDANLYKADFTDANLQHAYLRGARLLWARLHGADLRGADLVKANLEDADLEDADLRSADLRMAALYGARLQSTELRDAVMDGVTGDAFWEYAVEEGFVEDLPPSRRTAY